uniref:Uncharacterized protein n=2 Tax=Lutzomyia longipalpis TaxID=7200 RepID=A0A1B0GJ81_LUTLO
MELSDSICRVCMQKGEKIIISSDIIFMIHFCAQIADHERLPKGVCEQCHENLHVAYRFRTTCEESNDKFWELLGQLDEEGLELSFDAKNEGSTKRETGEVMEILEVVEEQLLSPKVEEYEGSSQEAQKIRGEEEILANEEQSLTLNDMQLTLPPDGNKVPTEEVSMNTELPEEKGIIKRRGRPRKSPHVVAECVAKEEKIAKPFQCSQCGRAFSRQKILNRHEKSHNDPPKERSRKLRGYHLTQHKRQVHGIIVTSHIRRLEKFLPERMEMNLMPAVIKDTPEEVQEVAWEQSM